MAERRVQVTFRKQVSDGNFGTEAAEVTLDDVVAEGDDEDTVAEGLLMEARRLVQAELQRSLSPRVRQAVTLATPRQLAPHSGVEPVGNPLAGDHQPWR